MNLYPARGCVSQQLLTHAYVRARGWTDSAESVEFFYIAFP
jgi:hypothetical protein